MLEKITDTLHARKDLKAWSVHHIRTRNTQQYDLREATETLRHVENERYVARVLRQTPGADGKPSCGTGEVTLLPGADIEKALDDAALAAGLVHNEPYDFPKPAAIPEVALTDKDLQIEPERTIAKVISRIKDCTSVHPQVRLTATECYAQEKTIHLVNSHGIDATQGSTNLMLELVFIAGEGDQAVESFSVLTRRRVADLDIEGEVKRRAQHAIDLLHVSQPPQYRGPVVMRGETLAEIFSSDEVTPHVLRVLSSGRLKYTGETPWEIGKPVFKSEVTGDPLTLWANRRLPYGTNSNSFDHEGIPAQRVELIRDNLLTAYTASQRYAQYLNIPPTGAFGDIELPPGTTPEADLRRGHHVEIVSFSWFNPNAITGDFACEIRLGYLINGDQRTPFKGGMLIGNLLEALANVHWSEETGFYGSYLGPRTARFNELTVAGKT
ncbi:MAG: hypothetical protein GTO14_06795 [Anaerolineales bacterium]|nr:hypothetical protein [Anaerolineales bacterium]